MIGTIIWAGAQLASLLASRHLLGPELIKRIHAVYEQWERQLESKDIPPPDGNDGSSGMAPVTDTVEAVRDWAEENALRPDHGQ